MDWGKAVRALAMGTPEGEMASSSSETTWRPASSSSSSPEPASQGKMSSSGKAGLGWYATKKREVLGQCTSPHPAQGRKKMLYLQTNFKQPFLFCHWSRTDQCWTKLWVIPQKHITEHIAGADRCARWHMPLKIGCFNSGLYNLFYICANWGLIWCDWLIDWFLRPIPPHWYHIQFSCGLSCLLLKIICFCKNQIIQIDMKSSTVLIRLGFIIMTDETTHNAWNPQTLNDCKHDHLNSFTVQIIHRF